MELFLRSGRGVRLTAAGERLYAITQGLFGQEEEAMLFLESARKLKVGLVRVGAVSPPIALELARNFKEAHPSLDLTVSIGSEESTLRGTAGLLHRRGHRRRTRGGRGPAHRALPR